MAESPGKFTYPNSPSDSLGVITTWYLQTLTDSNRSPVEYDLVCDTSLQPIAQWYQGCLVSVISLNCKTINLCGIDDDFCIANNLLDACEADCQAYEGEDLQFCLTSTYFETGHLKFCEILRCCTIDDDKSPQPTPREIEFPLTYEAPNAKTAPVKMPPGDWQYAVCRSSDEKLKIGPLGVLSVRSAKA